MSSNAGIRRFGTSGEWFGVTWLSSSKLSSVKIKFHESLADTYKANWKVFEGLPMNKFTWEWLISIVTRIEFHAKRLWPPFYPGTRRFGFWCDYFLESVLFNAVTSFGLPQILLIFAFKMLDNKL